MEEPNKNLSVAMCSLCSSFVSLSGAASGVQLLQNRKESFCIQSST